jgi:hypothetical protein
MLTTHFRLAPRLLSRAVHLLPVCACVSSSSSSSSSSLLHFMQSSSSRLSTLIFMQDFIKPGREVWNYFKNENLTQNISCNVPYRLPAFVFCDRVQQKRKWHGNGVVSWHRWTCQSSPWFPSELWCRPLLTCYYALFCHDAVLSSLNLETKQKDKK